MVAEIEHFHMTTAATMLVFLNNEISLLCNLEISKLSYCLEIRICLP